MDESEPVMRCSRCLLPSSLPDSSFNSEGECVWCQHGFPSYAPIGEERLGSVLQSGRRSQSPADCLVGVSGGKDSSYVLFQLKQKFGMRVEAFTYVHEAMSEYALQNAREICRALGVKQHLVSLPGNEHVDTFVAFFEAWLRSGSSDPFVAAAACAACKHIHRLGTRLASERGIPMAVWSDCPLENPPFIRGDRFDRSPTSHRRLTRMAARTGQRLLMDGGFRGAFLKHLSTCVYGGLSLRPGGPYFRLRYPNVGQIHYFDYCRWDREEILSALRAHTPWAVPAALTNDWHADCQLHVLREYAFQRMLATTATDAHLSNLVRCGMMTREQGWRELVRTKASQAAQLPEVLSQLGLQHLASRLDLTCFDIAEGAGRPG
jgi:hypothetical protein